MCKQRRRKWTPLLSWALLLLLFTLLLSGARRIPLTADEPAYIAGGYALLAQGRQGLEMLSQRGYPPLPVALEAILLYWAAPDIHLEQYSGWPDDYDRFAGAFRSRLDPVKRTAIIARMPPILLTVALAAVVFRWAKELWGHTAGSIALAALALDPTLLAHGRLANSDVMVVAIGTAALYTIWRWTQNKSWRWALGGGALLGVTLVAKLSGLLWFATSIPAMLVIAVQETGPDRRQKLILHAAGAAGLSLLILWGSYGFSWGKIDGLPFSAPAPTHWESLLYLDRYEGTYFALGRRQSSSWLWYYPVAFLIKNPLPFLVGLAVAMPSVFQRPPARGNGLVFLFPIVYGLAAVAEGMNIGYRFMLPIHPFLHLVLGGGLAQWAWKRRDVAWRRWLLIALGVWYTVQTARISPYEIAYFNELIGGPNEGYRYLVDSNLAWGQSDRLLHTYLEEHPDVQAEPPSETFRPAPGTYIVDATELHGIGVEDSDAYEWFRHRQPQEVLNYSLLIYDVPEFPMEWIVQCTEPAPPLDRTAIAEGTGRTDLRRTTFRCDTTWLYPEGGEAPGLYGLHHDLLGESRTRFPSLLPNLPKPIDPFVARHVDGARLSFEQRGDSERPAFALYEMSSGAPRPPVPGAVHAAAADGVPANLGASSWISVPTALDGPLTFLGAKAYVRGTTWDVETWWQVTETPVTRPFSIMAHLTSSDGHTYGVQDGLGVRLTALSIGDVVVQRHRFSGPARRSRLWLRTGAYWLDTGENWHVTASPANEALLVRLDVKR